MRVNVVFQQLTGTDLPKKDISQHGILRSSSHTWESRSSVPFVDKTSQVLDSVTYFGDTQQGFNSLELLMF